MMLLSTNWHRTTNQARNNEPGRDVHESQTRREQRSSGALLMRAMQDRSADLRAPRTAPEAAAVRSPELLADASASAGLPSSAACCCGLAAVSSEGTGRAGVAVRVQATSKPTAQARTFAQSPAGTRCSGYSFELAAGTWMLQVTDRGLYISSGVQTELANSSQHSNQDASCTLCVCTGDMTLHVCVEARLTCAGQRARTALRSSA